MPNTAHDWSTECRYIAETTDSVLHGSPGECSRALRNFNGEKDSFVRYCQMQHNHAARKGFNDSATYIQHCIDDLTDAIL